MPSLRRRPNLPGPGLHGLQMRRLQEAVQRPHRHRYGVLPLALKDLATGLLHNDHCQEGYQQHPAC